MTRLFAIIVGLLVATPQVSHASSVAYWSLFNIEGESAQSSVYITYDALEDMLNDTNRVGSFTPGPVSRNVVGSGAYFIADAPAPVPVPAAFWMMASAFGLPFLQRVRKSRTSAA